MDLFSMNRENKLKNYAPLADRMRPQALSDYFGQEDILSPGSYLRRTIESGHIPSMIFYGPPGTGKTSLAHVISKESSREFEKLSAVSSGKKDIEKIIQVSKDNLGIYNKRTIVFIDEIHSFNKTQQDALLPHVESGLITLIGATTENPYVSVNKALLSRCLLIELKSLKEDDILGLLNSALDKDQVLRGLNKEVDSEALAYLAKMAKGDARIALNTLELALMSSRNDRVSLRDMEESTLIKETSYDRAGDEHYDIISAFIKSIRGSDPQAAVYYLAKMLVGGEDPVFIARRLIILANEDIGLADPMALDQGVGAMYAAKNIGMPEARIPLAQAAIYMALAPKSNSAYLAINKAMDFVKNEDHYRVPTYLRDQHFGPKDGAYVYPHDHGGYVNQTYLPEEIKDMVFYQDRPLGKEEDLIKNHKRFKNN